MNDLIQCVRCQKYERDDDVTRLNKHTYCRACAKFIVEYPKKFAAEQAKEDLRANIIAVLTIIAVMIVGFLSVSFSRCG